MEKIALYPFDKTSQGIIKFRDLLDGYEVKSVIDFYFFVGKDVGEELEGRKLGIKVTDNIEEGLKGVDTLVLNNSGEIFMPYNPSQELIQIYKENNIRSKWKKLLKKADKKGIEIICTNGIYDQELSDWINQNEINIYIPVKSRNEVKKITDKYEDIKSQNEPKNIGIFGIRSCIGKFTTQMSLYRQLRKNYKVRILVTEPTGFLFSQPQLDNVQAKGLKFGQYISSLINKATKENFEYVIISDQGGLSNVKELKHIINKLIFLKSFALDEVILVVDYENNQVIQDCLDILRIYCGIDKVHTFLLPDRLEVKYGHYEKKSKEEFINRKKELKEQFEVDNVDLISNIQNIATKL